MHNSESNPTNTVGRLELAMLVYLHFFEEELLLNEWKVKVRKQNI